MSPSLQQLWAQQQLSSQQQANLQQQFSSQQQSGISASVLKSRSVVQSAAAPVAAAPLVAPARQALARRNLSRRGTDSGVAGRHVFAAAASAHRPPNSFLEAPFVVNGVVVNGVVVEAVAAAAAVERRRVAVPRPLRHASPQHLRQQSFNDDQWLSRPSLASQFCGRVVDAAAVSCAPYRGDGSWGAVGGQDWLTAALAVTPDAMPWRDVQTHRVLDATARRCTWKVFGPGAVDSPLMDALGVFSALCPDENENDVDDGDERTCALTTVSSSVPTAIVVTIVPWLATLMSLVPVGRLEGFVRRVCAAVARRGPYLLSTDCDAANRPTPTAPSCSRVVQPGDTLFVFSIAQDDPLDIANEVLALLQSGVITPDSDNVLVSPTDDRLRLHAATHCWRSVHLAGHSSGAWLVAEGEWSLGWGTLCRRCGSCLCHLVSLLSRCIVSLTPLLLVVLTGQAYNSHLIPLTRRRSNRCRRRPCESWFPVMAGPWSSCSSTDASQRTCFKICVAARVLPPKALGRCRRRLVRCHWRHPLDDVRQRTRRFSLGSGSALAGEVSSRRAAAPSWYVCAPSSLIMRAVHGFRFVAADGTAGVVVPLLFLQAARFYEGVYNGVPLQEAFVAANVAACATFSATAQGQSQGADPRSHVATPVLVCPANAGCDGTPAR